jgi:hypothetical protein
MKLIEETKTAIQTKRRYTPIHLDPIKTTFTSNESYINSKEIDVHSTSLTPERIAISFHSNIEN